MLKNLSGKENNRKIKKLLKNVQATKIIFHHPGKLLLVHSKFTWQITTSWEGLTDSDFFTERQQFPAIIADSIR